MTPTNILVILGPNTSLNVVTTKSLLQGKTSAMRPDDPKRTELVNDDIPSAPRKRYEARRDAPGGLFLISLLAAMMHCEYLKSQTFWISNQ